MRPRQAATAATSGRGRAVSEPRLVLLALVAVSAMVLCVLAIFETGDQDDQRRRITPEN